MTRELLIFGVAFVATGLSALSGAGSCLISVPIWTLLGIPLPLAIATESLSAAIWVLPAAKNYLRGGKFSWKFVLIFSTIGLVGAWFGVQFVLGVDPALLKKIVGGLILVLVGVTAVQKNFGLHVSAAIPAWRKKLMYVAALPMGWYESVLGSGNGIFFSWLGVTCRGWDFKKSLGNYYFVAWSWCVLAAILYIRAGLFELRFALPLVVGAMCGAWCGSHLGKLKGNTLIRWAFVGLGAVLGLQLLFG